MTGLSVWQQLHVVMATLTIRAEADDANGLGTDAEWHGGLADRVREVLDTLGYPHERPQS